ncbi:MAG: cytidylyltransferase domain-containing protein, partial [Candidatus Latescibacterota bacterium]
MRVGVVLQARMGSTRLPGKTLRLLLGQPMIHFVLERLKRIERADVI